MQKNAPITTSSSPSAIDKAHTDAMSPKNRADRGARMGATEAHAPQLEAARLLALAESLRQEIAALAGDDEETTRDTLEGEVGDDLDSILDFLIQQNDLDEVLVIGLKAQMALYTKRRARLEQRMERREALMLKVLTVAGWDFRERPLATLGRTRKAPALGQLDESKIPMRFWVEQRPELDRKALLKALKELKDGEKIPGAELAEKSYILAIRRA